MRQAALFLRQRQEGGTAIEFAFVFPIFMTFFMGTAELGMMRFGNSLMDNALNQLARNAMVGCRDADYTAGTTDCQTTAVMTPARMRRMIESTTMGLVEACDPEKFTFTAAPITGVTPNDPGAGINFGQESDVIVYHVEYRWPTIFPLFFHPYFNRDKVFASSMVVRNEPFGTVPNRDVNETC